MTINETRRVVMWLVALFMGFIAGTLILVIVSLVRENPVWNDRVPNATLMLALVIGWAFTTWLMLRRADGILTVIQRGFLIGVVEWILIGLLMTVLSSGLIPTPGADPGMPRASWEPDSRRVPLDVLATTMRYSVWTALAAMCLAGWGTAFVTARVYRRAVTRRATGASRR